MIADNLSELLESIALELARIDNRIDEMLTECRAETTSEMILDFERDFGMPDECAPSLEDTLAKRRLAVHTKETYYGRQDKEYFVSLTKSLGYTDVETSIVVDILEFTPGWVGIMVVGDPAADQEIIFHWYLRVPWRWTPYTSPLKSAFGSGFDLSFEDSYWFNGGAATNVIGDTLRCFVEKYKPAHTIVEVVPHGQPFDEAFGPSFRAMPTVYDLSSSAFDFGFEYGFDRVLWDLPANLSGSFSTAFKWKQYDTMKLPGAFGKGFLGEFDGYWKYAAQAP